MEFRKVFFAPGVNVPLSSHEGAPLRAELTEGRAIVVKGETFILHPSYPEAVEVDGAPEVETNKRIRRAIAKELPTRGERQAAGLLTEEDVAAMATESEEQQAQARDAWEAEKLARETPGARAKREAREAARAKE